ncbi:MAG: WYL domain-containing protein, partial [Lachnospiraceae bacterium]|nr:WYL domain-containing protein [Lachnospiraceae bacterium]
HALIRLPTQENDLDCDRRSVKNNILYLRELGYDISMESGYYLAQRQFEDAQLRLLIDSVLCSKNMTARQAKDLIDKLEACGNRYFKPKVSHVQMLSGLHHADNKQLMYVVDALNEAIDQKKKVAFYYNAYGTDFKLHKKRDSRDVVNPYQMVTANGFYYLIGNYDRYDNVLHFRLDKITDVEILNEKRKDAKLVDGLKNGLNLPRHMAEHIYMFGGESVTVQLSVPTGMMNALIAWFGKDFKILQQENDRMIIRVACNQDAMFYWSLQYGTQVEVLEPKSLRNEIRDAVKSMAERYDVC